MQPVAVVLNDSIQNIQNEVWQTDVFVCMCVCMYEKMTIQITSVELTHTYPKYGWYACKVGDVTYYLGNELLTTW